MPRPTRAQKDRRKGREEEALKASETSITSITNTPLPALNWGSCCTSSHLVSAGGEARVLTAINASEAVQDKRAEIDKERPDGGEREPSRKSGEVSLRPSQLQGRQKQRYEGLSFAGSKGFRQDFNGRNSSVSQSYEAENFRKEGYYQNRWRDRGRDDGGDSRGIDALGRALARFRAISKGDITNGIKASFLPSCE